jgi:hypothetical protein
VFICLQDEVRCDLLHLAFNSSNPGLAAAALDLLPSEDDIQPLPLPDDEALALLQTAVERHSPNRSELLAEIAACVESCENLTVVQLLPVLLRAMELDARVPQAAGEPADPYQPALRLWHLSTLPVFEELSPDAAAGLLETALKAQDCRSVLLLWTSMPAAVAIDPARLTELLQAAAAAGDAHSLRIMSRTPAFHVMQHWQLR